MKQYTCELCGKTIKKLGLHITKMHKDTITSQQYYDKYLKISENEGICPICNSNCTFLGVTCGYRTHCSCKCSTLDKNTQTKYNNTMLKKYGVKHNWNYGKLRQNCENTMLKKYNTIHNWKNSEVRAKNERLHVSKIEIYFKELLDKNNISYIHQYFDKDRYPFICDFYLINYDIFIEINAFPTHNNHFFNENNINDINFLQYLKIKANSSDFYKRYIEVWTIQDVEKLKIAQKNNLNYVVLWNYKDIDFYINYFKQTFLC